MRNFVYELLVDVGNHGAEYLRPAAVKAGVINKMRGYVSGFITSVIH